MTERERERGDRVSVEGNKIKENEDWEEHNGKEGGKEEMAREDEEGDGNEKC